MSLPELLRSTDSVESHRTDELEADSMVMSLNVQSS